MGQIIFRVNPADLLTMFFLLTFLTCNSIQSAFGEVKRQDLMGFSDNDGTEGTAWHVEGKGWHILQDVPHGLNAGLSGTLDIYHQPEEITYSPNGSEVPASAIVVAELYPDDYHKTYYAFEKGAVLGDASRAAGRRIYFGLYDDTFKSLTEEGLQLFNAAIQWGTDR
ncbi:MAG: hypothetical protein WD398_09040 [Cyclobacteriaceae bacterium]